MVNKLSEECDEECKNEKKKSFEIIDQLSSELDRQTLESDYKEITNSSFAFTTNQKRLNVVKSELEIIKNGIRSLSKIELVRKTATVLNQVLESVSQDETMSGVANVADAIASFIASPESLVTTAVLNIVDFFGGGGQTFEYILKMEFQSLKNLTETLLEKQKKFGKQKQLIENNTLKEFQWNDKFNEALTSTKAQQDVLDEKFSYLQSENNYQEDLKVLVGTKAFETIREKMEDTCFNTRLMKVNQTLYKNHLCTDLLYTYLQLNQFRDIIQSSLIKMVYNEGMKNLAVVNAAVYKERKQDLRRWLKEKMIDNVDLSCPLFITNKHFWTDLIIEQKVRKIIQNIDSKMVATLDRLDGGQCEVVEQENLVEYCGCTEEGSLSRICDINSQCPCKDSYRGEKCEIGEFRLFNNFYTDKQNKHIIKKHIRYI